MCDNKNNKDTKPTKYGALWWAAIIAVCVAAAYGIAVSEKPEMTTLPY